MSNEKNAAAVSLGKLGGLKGGKSKSPAKMAAMKKNLAKAQEARRKKPNDTAI